MTAASLRSYGADNELPLMVDKRRRLFFRQKISKMKLTDDDPGI